MKYIDLRKKIQEWKKYKGCKMLKRSPLINSGFKGTFNLSFTEDFWLKEYGRYIDFDHDFIFSTIQSCIRPEDFPLLDSEKSWKYLGVFEIADLNGVLTFGKKPNFEQLLKKQIKDLIKFFKEVGISPSDIYPSYNTGGEIKKITNGRYTFDFKIPEDVLSKDAFLEAGIPKTNLIKDTTRDTFLALHIHRPTPWGYRNEISINMGTKKNPKLLDVATIEYTFWKPKFKDNIPKQENINGLEESIDGFSIVAFGVERLSMVINRLKRIQDVDCILPLYEQWKTFFGKEDISACESLRALHRVCSDVIYYKIPFSKHINRHVKKRMNKLCWNIPKELTEEKIRTLLEINSKIQPWHKNLKKGINFTINFIENYKKNKKND